MISTDMSVKMRLRRVRSPARPSVNKIAARIRLCCIGTGGILFLLSLGCTASEMKRANQPCHEQQRCELYSDPVLAVERNADLLRADYTSGRRRAGDHAAVGHLC